MLHDAGKSGIQPVKPVNNVMIGLRAVIDDAGIGNTFAIRHAQAIQSSSVHFGIAAFGFYHGFGWSRPVDKTPAREI